MQETYHITKTIQTISTYNVFYLKQVVNDSCKIEITILIAFLYSIANRNIEVTADYLNGMYLYLYTGSPGYHGCVWIHVEVIIFKFLHWFM